LGVLIIDQPCDFFRHSVATLAMLSAEYSRSVPPSALVCGWLLMILFVIFYADTCQLLQGCTFSGMICSEFG